MSYLHGQKPVVIHGDLSCKNILVSDKFNAKIADFGLARVVKDYYSRSKTDTQLKGTTTLYCARIFHHIRANESLKNSTFTVLRFQLGKYSVRSKLLRQCR